MVVSDESKAHKELRERHNCWEQHHVDVLKAVNLVISVREKNFEN